MTDILNTDIDLNLDSDLEHNFCFFLKLYILNRKNEIYGKTISETILLADWILGRRDNVEWIEKYNLPDGPDICCKCEYIYGLISHGGRLREGCINCKSDDLARLIDIRHEVRDLCNHFLKVNYDYGVYLYLYTLKEIRDYAKAKES